jgi:hypothetical protein
MMRGILKRSALFRCPIFPSTLIKILKKTILFKIVKRSSNYVYEDTMPRQPPGQGLQVAQFPFFTAGFIINKRGRGMWKRILKKEQRASSPSLFPF